MKKVMIGAAVAAVAMAANAFTFVPEQCDEPIDPVSECPTLVFKVTACGKTVQDVGDGAYKSVTTLKISKGALAFLAGEACSADGETANCCYDTANLYAKVKVGKKTYAMGLEALEIAKWSVFGKNFEKAMNFMTSIKPGKSVSLESDLYIKGEDVGALFADDELEDTISLYATAFGSFKFKVSKAGKGSSSYCTPTEGAKGCDPIWTPKSYSGWFVGTRELVNDMYACFNCECGGYDLFGGTWKATYQAKYTTVAGAMALAGVAFDDDEDEE